MNIMNDPINKVQTIWASELYFGIKPGIENKFPVIIWVKECRTNDEYRIKAEMNLEQIKEYYKIFKYIVEREERKGEVNELLFNKKC